MGRKTKRIPKATVERVVWLLTETHLTQREIAKMVGINAKTVGRIARRQKLDYQAIRNARLRSDQNQQGTPERCPECGGLVYMPCLLCQVRWQVKSGAVKVAEVRAPESDGQVELGLQDEDRRRYEEVHAEMLESQGDLRPRPKRRRKKKRRQS